MAEEKFIMVSLKEEDAKRLAQVISNDTSRKILDFLAGRKDATETRIAEELGIPLSTVHYNLQALEKAKLVSVNEFHYSSRGKEVNHYSLANKYVIISPKEAPETLREKLKRILPVAVLGMAFAGAIELWNMVRKPGALLKGSKAPALLRVSEEAAGLGGEPSSPLFQEAAQDAAIMAQEAAPLAAAESSEAVTQGAVQAVGLINETMLNETVNRSAQEFALQNITRASEAAGAFLPEPAMTAVSSSGGNAAVWFLYGVIFSLFMVVLIDYLWQRKKR